jgi:hypothetical protein
VYWSCAFPCFVFLRLIDLLLGYGRGFLVGIWLLARWIYLESSVQIGCVVPRLLMRLLPGEGMIPDEGIMACPIG